MSAGSGIHSVTPSSGFRFDGSWVFLSLFFFWAGAFEMAPVHYPGQGMFFDFFVGVIVILIYFLCVLIHEGGHKLSAKIFRRFYDGNQLTIWGGVPREAESFTAVDPKDRIIRMAGPLLNLAFGIALHHLDASIRQNPDPLSEEIAPFIFFAMKVNLFLAMINLLPILPFDMGAILLQSNDEIHPRPTSRWMIQGGLAFAWVMTLIGLALATRGSLISGFGMIFFGVHLARNVVVWKGRLGLVAFLRNQNVLQFVEPDHHALLTTGSLKEAYQDHFYPSGRKRLPVCDRDGMFMGGLDWEELKKVPEPLRVDRTVGSLPIMDGARDRVFLGQRSWVTLFDAIERGTSHLFAVENERYVGIVFPSRVLEQYRMESGLGPHDQKADGLKMIEDLEGPQPNPPAVL